MNKLFCGRSNLLGDTVMYLPCLNILEQKYPNSHKIFGIAKKCQQGLKFWQTHPLISEILTSSDPEGNHYSYQGKDFNQKTEKLEDFIYQGDVNPDVPSGVTYNKYKSIEIATLMAGFSLEELYSLPEDQQRPRLYKNGPIFRYKKTIAYWPLAGYGTVDNRSPSKEWSEELVKKLIGAGYTIFHFGHPKEPTLSNHHNYFRLTEMELYNQVMIAIGCQCNVGTDSGSSWLTSSYGESPLVCLNTFSFSGHYANSCALAPMHYSKNQINLFDPNSCSNIPHDSVIQSIKDLS